MQVYHPLFRALSALVLVAFSFGSTAAEPDEPTLLTATGKPAEGALESFLGEPLFEQQVVFQGGDAVREPYLAVAIDGTVLALRNYVSHLRRSEDGGRSWGEIIEVPFGFLDSSMIVDENSGDILSVRLWDGTDRQWRSRDHGQTWSEETITLKPNEVMKWLERSGLKKRGTREGEGTDSGQYFLHANASESGITLRHGPHRGRLLVSATFRPHAKEHPSDKSPVDASYSCAIYSDDGGATWQVSGFFPEGITEEAAVVELSDGRLYYNSRSSSGYYDQSRARELRPEESLRRAAWSHNGGQTWEDLTVVQSLPDGGGYGRGYGMKGGLVRLPVKERDILLFSNADTAGGAREKMTVWASFDGGQSWPLKRLVDAGHGAYSCLEAGQPATPGEGMIYLLFEGGPQGPYSAMQFARFNLAWILEGEPTGDGDVPRWVSS